ncbi:MAG: Inorganic pyrophosphatase [Myxococcaceae bacterium]|nr:Inorganic pyrophosphatase [Myxococcaceae bacterium]
MSDLSKLPARAGQLVHVVVETPRGSPDKLTYDPALGAIVVSRPLATGLVYPYDWGFVPSTLAPDGDPLDAMVLCDSPHAPGVVVPARPVAAVLITQRRESGRGRERNDRVIFAPEGAARAATLSAHERRELARFFELAVLTEDKDVVIEGWDGAAGADALIRAAEQAWKRRHARAKPSSR